MGISWGPQLDSAGEQRWSSLEGPTSLLEGPTSSLKVGQDGAVMVHMAPLRAVLRALPCSPDLVPVLLGFLPCVMLHATVVILNQ